MFTIPKLTIAEINQLIVSENRKTKKQERAERSAKLRKRRS